MIEFLRTLPYEVEFGDEDFALEARNAGVLKESYSYYANLLKKVRKRYIRTIPNHKKYYKFSINFFEKLSTHFLKSSILQSFLA